MYIDNSFFVIESSYSLFEKPNNKGQFKSVFCPTYLRFEGLGYISKNGTYKLAIELPCNNNLIFKEIQAIIFEESNNKVFYTQLDLEQTFYQVQKNKYFKTFCGGKQLIKTKK